MSFSHQPESEVTLVATNLDYRATFDTRSTSVPIHYYYLLVFLDMVVALVEYMVTDDVVVMKVSTIVTMSVMVIVARHC